MLRRFVVVGALTGALCGSWAAPTTASASSTAVVASWQAPGHADGQEALPTSETELEGHAAHDDPEHGGGIRWMSPIFGNEGKTGLIWLLINFAVLMWLLNRILFVPLRRRQSTQHDKLKQELQTATQAREEAEAIIREYRARMERVDAEATEIIADAKARAEVARQEIIAGAEREAKRIQDAARAAAERDADLTRRTIEDEVLGRAIDKAEQLLRARIQPTDQNSMVDDYIARLEPMDLRGGAA